MPKLSSLKLNLENAEEGVWVPYELGIEFKIARFGNSNFRTHLRTSSRGEKFAAKKGVKPNLTGEDVIDAIVDSILLDWKNLDDDNGEPIPYTEEMAKEILNDPCYSEILEFITEASRDYQLFRESEDRDAEEN